MKTPSYYHAQAERRRAAAFACMIAFAFGSAVLGAALVGQLPRLAILSAIAAVLLFAAGLKLLALARAKDKRAIEEECYRSREDHAPRETLTLSFHP